MVFGIVNTIRNVADNMIFALMRTAYIIYIMTDRCFIHYTSLPFGFIICLNPGAIPEKIWKY